MQEYALIIIIIIIIFFFFAKYYGFPESEIYIFWKFNFWNFVNKSRDIIF